MSCPADISRLRSARSVDLARQDGVNRCGWRTSLSRPPPRVRASKRRRRRPQTASAPGVPPSAQQGDVRGADTGGGPGSGSGPYMPYPCDYDWYCNDGVTWDIGMDWDPGIGIGAPGLSREPAGLAVAVAAAAADDDDETSDGRGEHGGLSHFSTRRVIAVVFGIVAAMAGAGTPAQAQPNCTAADLAGVMAGKLHHRHVGPSVHPPGGQLLLHVPQGRAEGGSAGRVGPVRRHEPAGAGRTAGGSGNRRSTSATAAAERRTLQQTPSHRRMGG